MGREIKFRGKRLDNGEWVYGTVEFHLVDGDLTKTKRDAFITFDSMDKIGKVYRYRYQVDPETVGQFTGLRDKNGKGIYEGDIVNMHYFFENHNRETLGAFEDEMEVVGVVRIDEMSVYTDCKKRRFDWVNYLEEPTEELEVIGNIYENGDLLK